MKFHEQTAKECALPDLLLGLHAARKPLVTLSHSLVDAKMVVVGTKCGRDQKMLLALRAQLSFGPPNLKYACFVGPIATCCISILLYASS
jgi:hypothetical protein